MRSWQLVLAAGPHSAQVADLPVVPTFRYELDGPWTCKFRLPYAEDACTTFYQALAAGVPKLIGYRRSADDEDAILRFSGGLEPIRESTDPEAIGNADSVELTFTAGPAFPLQDRLTSYETNNGTAVASGGTLVAQDAGTIAKAIIDEANDDVATGIRMGTVTATTDREKSYSLANAWTAIRDMTAMQTDNGFDLDVTCLDPAEEDDDALCEVNIVSALGIDRTATAKFQLGEGTLANTLRVDREWSKPRNRVTTTVNHALLDTVVAATVDDTDSQAKYGLFAYSEETPDALNDADLTDRATRLLLPDPGQTVVFHPDPAAPNCPQPFEDYWLGDTVSFYARRDGLQIDTTARIVAIEIELDDSGNEIAHRVEYGQPRVTPARLLGKLASRVYWLERSR